jgi:hypothetical protein
MKTTGYKKEYAVYAHHRITKKEYSEYVSDYNIVSIRLRRGIFL